jgi:hypothetical protein
LLLFPRVSRKTFVRLVMVLAGIAAIATIVVVGGFVTAESPIWWSRHANGLLAASPVLILAFVCVRGRPRSSERDCEDERHERTLRAVWLIILLYLLLYVLLTPRAHAGGIHWGCRYLLPVVPLMGVMAGVTLARWWTLYRGAAGRALLCLSLALTVCAQVYSQALLHARKRFAAEVNHAVAAAAQEVVVASGWYMPQELAPNFFEKRIYLIRSPRQLHGLISELRRADEREILLVASPPMTEGEDSESRILEDGSLRFISVELRPLRLGEPATTTGR